METTRPPLLVIVTGLPCTGKTTLAHRLAREVPLPIIAKDDLKESLFDSLGWADKDWSMKLGRASILLLYQIIEKILSAGMPVIAETYFHPDLARAEFEAIRARAPFRPYVIECIAEGDVLYRRWQQRITSGERHPGHVDDTAADEAVRKVLLQGRSASRLDLGGLGRVIDTTVFEGVDVGSVVEAIRAAV